MPEESTRVFHRCGIVIIGRNEGDRLRRCLNSVSGKTKPIVYVDSGSVDGSVLLAKDLGVEVLELDMSISFTAARARNAGFSLLRELIPGLPYVQFVDGDCEIVDGWLEEAWRFLDDHPEVAVVCGRRRERFPRASVYNLLCDMEWDTPIGEAKACGGDSMMRMNALGQVGAFNEDMIAGEEPELCVRLRKHGWKIWRLEREMTLHDAAITSFGQWWKRTFRSGFAFAEGAYLHGAPPERHWVTESRRALMWGLLIPLAVIAGLIVIGFPALLILLVYPIQVVRLAVRGNPYKKEFWARAFFLVLGRFPEAMGQVNFLLVRLTRQNKRLIEYK